MDNTRKTAGAHEEMQYASVRLMPDSDIEIGEDPKVALDGSVPATVTAWVRFKGLCSQAVIVSQKGIFSLELREDRVYCSIGNVAVRSSGVSGELKTDRWYHVAVSIWPGKMCLCIDGTANISSSLNQFTPLAKEAVRLGGQADMDLMRVTFYNTGLSTDDVRQTMFSDVGSKCCDIDLTQNPPKDTVTPTRVIKMKPGAASTVYSLGLRLSERAYAIPTAGQQKINPGGSGIDPYTIFARFYVEGGAYAQALFTNCNFEDDCGMALFLRYDKASDGYRVHSLRGAYGPAEHELLSTKTFAAKRWTTVATVYDGRKLSIYIDGILDNSADFVPIGGRANEGRPIVGGIFQYNRPTGRNVLRGYISRMTVLNRAATADEIASIHKGIGADLPEGSVLSLNFAEGIVQNDVDGAPLALCDGAIVEEWSGPAVKSIPSLFTLQEPQHTPEAEAERQRRRLDERPYDMAEFLASRSDLPPLSDEASGRYFSVSDHTENGQLRIFVHTDEGSYEAFCGPADEIDPYTLWKIKLVFTLIGGVIYLLFGLKTLLSTSAINKLHGIIHASRVILKFNDVRKMTLTLVWDILNTLNKENLLFQLAWVLLRDIGLRQCLRAIGKLTFKITTGSIFADLAMSIAELLYEMITVYNERPAQKPDIPPVALTAVRFNTTPGNGNLTSALTIRIDQLTDAVVPEWQSTARGLPVRTQPIDTSTQISPVAYTVAQLGANNIAIDVMVACDPAQTVYVRGTGGSFLGNVPPFIAVNGGYVRVTLAGGFAPTGVIRFLATWQWEYSYDNVTWAYLDRTDHIVYAVLNAANTEPYVSDGNTNLQSTTIPSSRVLDTACFAANAAATYQAAAAALCREINQNMHIQYDGAVHYYFAAGRFDLTRFLREKLSGATIKLECSEVATLMCVYANSLGCDLQYTSIFGLNGHLNYTHILPIGRNIWSQPDAFDYHVVNISGAGGITNVNNLVFDACLHLDGSNDPWAVARIIGPAPILPGHTNATQFTTLAAPAAGPIATPYAVLNSYRERFLRNTVNDRTLVCLGENITI